MHIRETQLTILCPLRTLLHRVEVRGAELVAAAGVVSLAPPLDGGDRGGGAGHVGPEGAVFPQVLVRPRRHQFQHRGAGGKLSGEEKPGRREICLYLGEGKVWVVL